MNGSSTEERDWPAGQQARVIAVKGPIVSLEAAPGQPLMKNEVAHLLLPRAEGAPLKLKAEVLRVRGRIADAQVFEDTRGLRVGDAVELSGRLLSVTLGPGLLGQVYDGLQNPLESLARELGFFLPRGVAVPPLDPLVKWAFSPRVRTGDRVRAGEVLGTVQERRLCHRIMVPFDAPGELEVSWIQAGSLTVDEPVARLRSAEGSERSVGLAQQWPVRRPLPQALLRRRLAERLYPDAPLPTTIRIIDTLFPIAEGGTACIPGPFGAGKTVLQGLIARHSAADIVIVVACGERAGEVVETITEFPDLRDPRSGGSLMDRTVIVCNTSSMPVAAREASIYTGVTLGEYYRQMGYRVLLIADSTSRWAQAMRETSARLEEIPGEEAYPAYLDSAIKGIYERAGVIRNRDGRTGSLSFIGTVSPAGGNLEEPVTQSTMGTVKVFLGLSADRAYKRFYPAIDPLISWSRYLEQLAPWYARSLRPGWIRDVQRAVELLRRGEEVAQMMQVTGEEGITLEDFVVHQKAVFLDMVYLQQDAFDPVDASVPLERQVESFDLLLDLLHRDYHFADKDAAREFFTRLTGLVRNLNYAPRDSDDYTEHRTRILELAEAHTESRS